MSLPDAWRDALAELPEQELLREPDRLRAYTDAFLRGEIDLQRYNALTMAELDSRVPMLPEVAVVRPERHPNEPRLRVVQPVIRPRAATPVAAEPESEAPTTRGERVRTHADAYVRGEISGDEFLRLARGE